MTSTEAAPSEPETASPETVSVANIVICVHGTGAADTADSGSKWWQFGSKFNDLFAQSLEGSTVVDPPFHWSGRNSESERRKAGMTLLAKLRQIEAAGTTYHLVGHSHGGSVIWHALVASAVENQPLSGLRSWATVGTPFLKFAVVRPSPWRWITATIMLGLVLWLLTLAPWSDWLPALRTLKMGGAYRGLAFVALFFGASAVLCLWALFRIGFPALLLIFAKREQTGETQAASWYGERWLALWHPLDEPTNSLAGTLGPAPFIAPRVTRDGIFGFIPLAGTVINGTLARAADEFAWQLVTDRAQGADRRGYGLANAGRSPPAMFPGFESLPAELASRMAAIADANSAGSMHRLRDLLEQAYDTESSQAVLDHISLVVSFQEIIHTSYFDYPEMAQLLAAQIRTKGVAQAALGTDTTIAGELKPPKRIAPSLTKPQSRPAARNSLEFVLACLLFVAPAIVLAAGARAAYEAVVAPLTTNYQIDSIAGVLSNPSLLSASNSADVGELLLGLDALGRVTDPIAAIDKIPQSEPRMRTAARLAWIYGATTQMPQVDKLLKRSESPGELPLYSDVIKVLAFSGYADQHGETLDKSFATLATDFLDEIQQKPLQAFDLRTPLLRLLLVRLELANAADLRDRALSFLQADSKLAGNSPDELCTDAQRLAPARVQRNPGQPLESILNLCPTDSSRTGIIRIAKKYLVNLHDKAKLDAFYQANKLQYLNADQIEKAIQANVDANTNGKLFPSDPFSEVVPDLIQLESHLDADTINDLQDMNGWPKRLGGTRFFDFLNLTKTMKDFGASQLSNIFIEAAHHLIGPPTIELDKFGTPLAVEKAFLDGMQQYGSLIATSAAVGRPDLARARTDEVVLETQKVDPSQGSVKLICYGEIAIAAAALDDAGLAQLAAAGAAAVPIKDLDFMGTSSMLDVADGVSTVDPVLGRPILERAQEMADITTDDSKRASTYLVIASLWIKLGDYRLARLAADKNIAAHYTMQLYAEILDAALGSSDNAMAQDLLVGKHKVPVPKDIDYYLTVPMSLFSK